MDTGAIHCETDAMMGEERPRDVRGERIRY